MSSYSRAGPILSAELGVVSDSLSGSGLSSGSWQQWTLGEKAFFVRLRSTNGGGMLTPFVDSFAGDDGAQIRLYNNTGSSINWSLDWERMA